MIPEICNIPYFEILIDIYTGKNYSLLKEKLYHTFIKPKKKSMLIQFILQKEGYFVDLIFPEILYRSPYYYYSEIIKEKNTFTKLQNKNQDRLGFYILSGFSSIHQLKIETESIHSNIKIIYR